MDIHLKIYHDTRRVKKGGKFPIKLRLTLNREQRYYAFDSKFDLSKEEFKMAMSEKPKATQFARDEFDAKRLRAKEIIDSLGIRFSFGLFEKRFFGRSGADNNMLTLLADRAKELRKEARISTAITFENTLSNLKRFHDKSTLEIESIDVSFLNKYKRWNNDEGNSNATVGIYARNIRSIINTAISEGVLPKELYPFGKKQGLFTIPTGKNIKKALKLAEIAAIYNYKTKEEHLERARDFWLLSYLSNGINPKDICLLRYKNIDGDMIRFERAKTRRSNEDNPIIISFPFTSDIKAIVKKWGNKNTNPSNFVFPVLNLRATPDEEYKLIRLFIAFVNKNMKKVCEELKLSLNVRTYEARHSFSTILRNSGKSVEAISEALGHKSVKTTQSYLAGFEDDAKKDMVKALTDFTSLNKKEVKTSRKKKQTA